MYNIGYIDTTGDKYKKYLEPLSKNYCYVFEAKPEKLKNHTEIDLLILFDDSDCDIEKTSKKILEIRKHSDAFLWVVSCKANSIGRLVYLKIGADVNICEEHTPEELQLMILKTLDRVHMNQHEPTKMYNSMKNDQQKNIDFEIDRNNMSVRIDGKEEVRLTSLEFRILDLLYLNKKETVTYKDIYENVWAKEFTNERYKVANVVFHLREKIEKNTTVPCYIKTIRSRGYLLDV